jgi:hypothetical protein
VSVLWWTCLASPECCWRSERGGGRKREVRREVEAICWEESASSLSRLPLARANLLDSQDNAQNTLLPSPAFPVLPYPLSPFPPILISSRDNSITTHTETTERVHTHLDPIHTFPAPRCSTSSFPSSFSPPLFLPTHRLRTIFSSTFKYPSSGIRAP